jgi:transcriptional regulator with XRE-family HTH domain
VYGVMNADKVRQLRARKGMSKRDLAIAAGVSESTARRVELGARVQGETAWKVAGVFGLHPRDIGRPYRRPADRSKARLYLVR